MTFLFYAKYFYRITDHKRNKFFINKYQNHLKVSIQRSHAEIESRYPVLDVDNIHKCNIYDILILYIYHLMFIIL